MREIKTFDDFTGDVQHPETPSVRSRKPTIFCLEPAEAASFRYFCKEQQIDILDMIDQQLVDFARVRFPSVEDTEDRKAFISDLLAEYEDPYTYGNWVYLPWQKKVVHVLPEEGYFEVITNRNQLKITREEQERLRTKRVGIVGLSVGAEAAITVAQEHLCGEMVIADFDELELSNLNRLNARFDEIGLPKTTITARRIAGINPYLDIMIFEDGIMEQNMEQFLDGLDLLLEECDDLTLKFTIRKAAKEMGLNIVYAADERGMISVEPYEYVQDLAVFHGKVAEPPPPKESFSDVRNFWKELTVWLGGWDLISDRSQKSVQQIGESLCGYPQLAGEARFAAGEVAHVARRLLLGEQPEPQLKHVDLHSIITGGS